MGRVGWAVTLLVLVGCGGRSLDDGVNQAGGSGAAAVGGASSGGAPSAGASSVAGAPVSAGSTSVGGSSLGGADASGGTCGGTLPSASPVVFEFTSTMPLWLSKGCTIDFEIVSGCDGETLTTDGGCYADCAHSACSPCSSTCSHASTLVAPGSTPAETWDGNVYDYQIANACTRTNHRPAPSGRYDIAVTAYLSQQDAASGVNGYFFQQEFELPAPDGVVFVPLEFRGI